MIIKYSPAVKSKQEIGGGGRWRPGGGGDAHPHKKKKIQIDTHQLDTGGGLPFLPCGRLLPPPPPPARI